MRIWALAMLGAALAAACIASLAVGDQTVALGEVLGALAGDPETPQVSRVIVLDLRLPRVVLAALVGAALGLAGTLTQAIMRNPLAEPGALGINAGAALAAMVVIVRADALPESLLPVFAFAGALAMSATIYVLSWRAGTTSLRIILIGIGLGALAGAGASFISVFGPVAEVQRAMVWLAGSLNDARWVKVQWLVLWGLPALALALVLVRDLNLIALGDTVARGLGQRVDAVRGLAILCAAMLAGASVAAAGPISFVGLVAPHVARRIVGRHHAVLLPTSALCGALLVVLADLAARRVMAPAQVPVGLAAALIGAPFFGYILWKTRHE
ncbi:MAG: iron ABC transporter permease [Pseudomonadota bacterium]|nr:iron ABC transporter permease [Pseudomonadota bacterium]